MGEYGVVAPHSRAAKPLRRSRLGGVSSPPQLEFSYEETSLIGDIFRETPLMLFVSVGEFRINGLSPVVVRARVS